MILHAQLMLVPYDESLPADAPAVGVLVADDGTVTVTRPDSLPCSATLDGAAARRLAHAVAARRLEGLSRTSGVGASWALLSTPSCARAVRYTGAPGVLDPAVCSTMPAAFADLFDVVLRAARAVQEGSLRGFVDGFAEVVDPAGVLLRFKRSSSAHPNAAPWVVAYADGRVEQWKLDDSSWAGQRVAQRRVDSRQIAAAAALARRVLQLARPAMHHGHDPSEALELELLDEGRAVSATFLWGRASGLDAHLAPVEGEGAIEAFDALANLLVTLSIVDHGSGGPR